MSTQPTATDTATATGTARGLSWIGTRTDRPEQMSRFLADVLGIPVVERTASHIQHAVADNSRIEVYTATDPEPRQFATGPVPGVLVDNVHASVTRLRAAGVELLGPTYEENGHAWQQFRAPDGHVWEITHRPAAATHQPTDTATMTTRPVSPVPAAAADRLRFQQHLRIYAAVIAVLVSINALTSPDVWWAIWPALGWGLGLLLHANRMASAADHRRPAR